MSNNDRFVSYTTSDCVGFLVDRSNFLTDPSGVFFTVPPDRLSKLYDGVGKLDTDSLRALLSELYPKENWKGYEPMDWTIEKNDSKRGAPESYTVMEKNLNLRIMYDFNKTDALLIQKLKQGLHKKDAFNKDDDYIEAESFIQAYPKDSGYGPRMDALSMEGRISSSQSKSFLEVLEPSFMSLDFKKPKHPREFYLHNLIVDQRLFVMPALPSKIKKVTDIMKSAWNKHGFFKIEDYLDAIETLQGGGFRKQAKELKAELDEKINFIRKSAGLI